MDDDFLFYIQLLTVLLNIFLVIFVTCKLAYSLKIKPAFACIWTSCQLQDLYLVVVDLVCRILALLVSPYRNLFEHISPYLMNSYSHVYFYGKKNKASICRSCLAWSVG